MRDYNFFDAYNERHGSADKTMLPTVAAITVLILGVLVAQIILRTQIKDMNAEMARIQDYLNSEEVLAFSEEYDRCSSDISALQGYQEVAGRIRENVTASAYLDSVRLTLFSGRVPANVSLESLSLSGSQVSMQFSAPNLSAVASLTAALNELEFFESVHTSMAEREEETQKTSTAPDYGGLLAGILAQGVQPGINPSYDTMIAGLATAQQQEQPEATVQRKEGYTVSVDAVLKEGGVQ